MAAAAKIRAMSRREFVSHIALAYAMFEADVHVHHADGKPAPLDRQFAYYRGRGLVETGRYRPRVRALDYERIAREARRLLPGERRTVREAYVTEPRECQACGGHIEPASDG